MQRVHYVHWNEADLEERAARVAAPGFEVDTYPLNVPGARTRFREDPPDAVVVDLSRLPSHGREVAVWLTDTKSTSHVPVIFVDGAADKVELTRQRLPTAEYCAWKTLSSALRRVLKEGSRKGRLPRAKVPQKPNLAGYSGTPLLKKLGIRAGMTVRTINAPDDLSEILGPLPDGAELRTSGQGRVDLVLWFTGSLADFERRIDSVVARLPEGGVWICWPKLASGVDCDLSQNEIRTLAIAAGLVDFKVCSVNAIWSGLKFARKK